MKKPLPWIVGVILYSSSSAGFGALLTDLTVFSTNEVGNVWLSWIWNTRGNDTDTANRWNLYVSPDSLSESAPTFVNGFNDASARVSLELSEGDNRFSIYGEGVGPTGGFDDFLHFVLNVYLDGNQGQPDISGLQKNNSTDALTPASHPNGMDIFGATGQQQAGTLSTTVGAQHIELTEFTWITSGQRDIVWPHWANDAPYASGSGTLDYYGAFNLKVSTVSVPAPATSLLIGLGACLIGLAGSRRPSHSPLLRLGGVRA